MMDAERPRNARGRYQRHGLHTLKRAVHALGSRALPSKSTALGRALHGWRESLLSDLGGASPVVRERQALVGQLQSLLRDLGLDRRAKDVDVAAALAALHDKPTETSASRASLPARSVPQGRHER